MMRSLFSGVAGLKTHQVKMDVIGNNIANVNTVAYKSQSITFSELMYQTTQSASGPNGATGAAGTNAKQIGLGVQSAAISTAISQQGSTQTTGNAFDLRITGDAFFIVGNGTKSDKVFTRDGSFYVDAIGNLAMSSNGYNVMGWQVIKDGDDAGKIRQDNVSPLRIMSPENLTSNPEATTKATMSGIVDKNCPQILSEEGKVVNLAFYDKMGYPYTARFKMNGTDVDGEYILKLADVLDADNNTVLDKFDANIFTGSSTGGSPATATDEQVYSMNTDAYGMPNTANGVIVYEPTDAQTTTPLNLDPSDIFSGYSAASGKISDESTNTALTYTDVNGNTVTLTKKQAADKYAEAFGFSNYEKFCSRTITDYAATPPESKTVGEMLQSGTLTYTDADGNATSLFVQNGSDITMSSSGYQTAAGDAVKVYFNQETGTITGIGAKKGPTSFSINITPTQAGVENPFGDDDDHNIVVDMSATKNLNNEQVSTITATSGDEDGQGTGCALGTMTGVSIQKNGMIYGAYDNGQTKLLGQIAVATFSNAAGLEKEGDNLYRATLNSGKFDGIGVDISANGGYMSTGVLEMSNVDLSSEFTELITTQRGFQANSRIITVSDTLLEELVNLKR